MIRPSLTSSSDTSDTDRNERITTAIVDALESNDKTIEIRPATQSSGMGLSRLLLLVTAVVGIGYWLRTSQRPNAIIENARSETADRTEQATEQAKETIQGGSETFAENVEEGSETAGQMVEEAGEEAANKVEETGDTDDDDTFANN